MNTFRLNQFLNTIFKKRIILLFIFISLFIPKLSAQIIIGEGETWYRDSDGDGKGDPNIFFESISQPSGYVANSLDCNDFDDTVYTGAPELADGKDNDCDGLIDEGLSAPDTPESGDVTITNYCGYTRLTRGTPPSGVTWYWQSSSSGTSTSNSSSYINRYSGNTYYLRARNSSGSWSDTSLSINYTINTKSYFYADSDGDGLGDPSTSQYTCSMPAGYVTNNEDQCPSTAGAYSGCPTPTSFTNMNYVRTRTYRTELDDPVGISGRNDIQEEITYMDGLGRPVQHIMIEGSKGFADVVTHMEYDGYGRQVMEFLPYPDPDGDPGSFQTGAGSQTNSFYWNKFGTDGFGSSGTTNAYSKKEFEASPLNRVLKQAAPGEDWKLNGGHEIEYGYKINGSNEVRLYKVTLTYTGGVYEPDLSTSGYYNAGELIKNVTYDENNINKATGHSTEEFIDKKGHTVLKRTYEGGVKHDTYYVYDNYGNLTYVLPPKSDPNSGEPSSTELSELCYQYKYDKRNRLVEKKIPGKGWEYIVYNKLDQPVLTQDANMRRGNSGEPTDKWLFTKYDAFGRVAYTGLKNVNTTRESYQQLVDDNFYTQEYVTRSVAYSYAGTTVYYTNEAIPTSMDEIYTINYYDSYDNLNIGFAIPTSNGLGETIVKGIGTKGLATVTKTKVLGTSQWITTATGYDAKGRVVWVKTNNPYLGTTDIVENKLDFIGNVEESKTTHQKTGKSDIVLRDYYSYDHMNRLKTHTQSINGGSQEVIAENTYDELGQLVGKGVGNTDGNNRLQDIAYTYNVRGWLKKINDVGTTNKLFNFKLYYNDPISGTALYNGNISQAQWRTDNDDSSLKSYMYYYDDLNRLQKAIDNTGKFNVGSTSPIAYDKNGNITRLERLGWVTTGPNLSINYGFGEMDKLTYYYQGNRLMKVNDAAINDQYGFKDDIGGSTFDTTDDYAYDTNGNLTSDANKGIPTNGISYNHLNLPTSITLPGGTITYTYDATGVKLRKVAGSTTTDYASGFIYENNNLKQFSHSEGYIEPDGSGGFDYAYQYKDHLGNVRLSYSDLNGNGTIDPSSEILQEQNYYPFGLEHKGYNSTIIGTENNYFTYNGKELNKELGLNWHDFGSRNYDSSLGRWMNIDPKAELLEISSPYVYALNSPLVYIDEDGELPILINGKTMSDSERADESYWTTEIVNTIKNSGIANPGGGVHYVDGNRGHRWNSKMGGYASEHDGGVNSPSRRAQGGRYAAESDWNSILSQLERDPETGKITEKIQIYTHSRGAAFGIGYTEKLLQLIKDNSDQFADPSNVIDFVYNMAPHQSDFLTGPDGVGSYSMDHSRDKLSDNDMGNVIGAFTSDEKSAGFFGAHSITSFKKDLKAFTSAFLKGGTGQDVIDNFISTMKEEYGINVTVKQ